MEDTCGTVSALKSKPSPSGAAKYSSTPYHDANDNGDLTGGMSEESINFYGTSKM